MSKRRNLSVLTALFGSKKKGSTELWKRLIQARKHCQQQFDVSWLDAQAERNGKTKWVELLANPDKLSYEDLLFYLGLFDKDLGDFIPEIRTLAADEARVKPFHQRMVNVDRAFGETIHVEREPETPDEWSKTLIGHLCIYLMQELNDLSGHTMRESEKLARLTLRAS